MDAHDDDQVPRPDDATTEEESREETVTTEVVREPIRSTRISRAWMAILPALVVLAVILVFILQNSRDVTVSFFTASGTLPLSVALLGAAALGALLVLALGSARMLQLRRQFRRSSPGSKHRPSGSIDDARRTN